MVWVALMIRLDHWTIDYRATYVYRTGNGHATNSNALGCTETLTQILSTHKDYLKGHLLKPFVELMDELLSYSWRKLGSVVFSTYH